jgi:uncharacterized protein (TIGR00299 family) protein
MLLGALLGAGWPERALHDVIARLGVPVRIRVDRVDRRGVPALHVEVVEEAPPHSRPYPVLAGLLADSGLDDSLRRSAASVFERLAAVEATVHSRPIEAVHLHELGGVDTLVDVVGVLAGFRALQLDRVAASPVNLGRGWVAIRHGVVPVPPPATAALIEGMPVYSGETEGELLTPTGAVLLSALVRAWGPLPPMRLDRVGTGAGTADPPRANVLRLFVGTMLEGSLSEASAEPPAQPSPHATSTAIGPEQAETRRLVVLETSIDDMNPQFYPHVTDALFAAGALDVMVIPALMKKGRPGHLLRVLAHPGQAQTLYRVIVAETTTLGVRTYDVTRIAVGRRRVDVQTEFGVVPVKVGEDASGVLTMTPEFEACRALAEGHGVPVKRVIAAAQRAAAALAGHPERA